MVPDRARRRRRHVPVALFTCVVLISLCVPAAFAAEKSKPKRMTPGGKWEAGSMERPRPMVITPPTPATLEEAGRPPSDAIVLFDGSGFDEWEMYAKRAKPPQAIEPAWKLTDGFMEVVARTGDLHSKRDFGDCQIHVEWATPAEVKGASQGRGNSGVLLLGQCEIQVLDSFENDTYPDGQTGALYGKYPPLVNVCRKPGEWQTYDIVFFAPRFEGEEMTRPASLTVLHNGVVIHHAANPGGRAERIRLGLQDHNNPVRYRNVWVRELRDYDYVAGASDNVATEEDQP